MKRQASCAGNRTARTDAIYTLAGVAALIDQGKKIVVLTPEREATRLALQMAIHKYGGLIDAKEERSGGLT